MADYAQKHLEEPWKRGLYPGSAWIMNTQQQNVCDWSVVTVSRMRQFLSLVSTHLSRIGEYKHLGLCFLKDPHEFVQHLHLATVARVWENLQWATPRSLSKLGVPLEHLVTNRLGLQMETHSSVNRKTGRDFSKHLLIKTYSTIKCWCGI